LADITIYDVASKAGVSISTVSLALNHPHRVRDATRTRVMDAIHELGFVPKADAVIRARQGIGRIGAIAPFSSFLSFAQRLTGVLRVAAREGLEVVIYDQESAAEARLATLPLTRRVDGLIVMSLPFSDDVAQRLIDQAVPMVLIELGHPGFSSITIDDEAGGRMVAELFAGQGHERFGYLGHAQTHDYLSQSQLRLQGFLQGLPSLPEIRLVRHTFTAAHAGALRMLTGPERPTAIFAHDDILASGVLKAARELGLAVPGDLAVAGFDDSPLAEPLGLTSVRQPLEESGQIAAETLVAQLSNPDASARNVTLALTLIERESTATTSLPGSRDGQDLEQQHQAVTSLPHST
jgi:DNA-binding LacI/PurR family transcriptional regulator